jgi:hypothetical protein
MIKLLLTSQHSLMYMLYLHVTALFVVWCVHPTFGCKLNLSGL